MKINRFILFFLLFHPITIIAQNGNLDNSFSDNGIVTTAVGEKNDIAYDLAIQSDGKIVVAGISQNSQGMYDFAVVRYNINGTPDNGFSSDGKVITSVIEGTEYANGVAIQEDGKIVVAGNTILNNAPYDDYVVVRYNSDGTLDQSFHSGGIVKTNISRTDKGRSVAIQPDGKIVVAGYSYSGTTYDFSMVRYFSDGSLDTAGFGDKGKVMTDITQDNDYGMGMALQTNGKIIVVGTANRKLAIVRYNQDGSVDTDFGSGGATLISLENGLVGNDESVTIQPDNKIVVSCSYYNQDGLSKIAVVRCDTTGAPDTEWGTDGIVKTSIGDSDDESSGIALQTDGKVLVSGFSFSSSSGDNFALVRYNTDGTPDNNFGNNGILTTSVAGGDGYDDAYAMTVDDDKIILCGRADNGSDYDFAVVRYLQNSTTAIRSEIINTAPDLFQNYPNPFHNNTVIKYTVPEISDAGIHPRVTLAVYDREGRKIATLVDKHQSPGIHQVIFHAPALAAGVYFYKLQVDHSIVTRKLVVVK